MELIWAIIKLIEYTLFGPVWWLASYLASYFFPFEGDGHHDLLAIFFSMIIVGLLIWAGIRFL